MFFSSQNSVLLQVFSQYSEEMLCLSCCPREQSRDAQSIYLEVVRDISCLWHVFCFHSGSPIHLAHSSLEAGAGGSLSTSEGV